MARVWQLHLVVPLLTFLPSTALRLVNSDWHDSTGSDASARARKVNGSANSLQADATAKRSPSAFVAVFSARATPERRAIVRKMWQGIGSTTGTICTRFAICHDEDGRQEMLDAEQAQFGDLMLLDCEEGYARGLLTLKLLAAMRAYVAQRAEPCYNKELFMKVDDDTFVSRAKFVLTLQAAALNGMDDVYMGVPAGLLPPIRDQHNKWYEPKSTWPHAFYPAGMHGGPGYIVSGALVRAMLDNGVADSSVLWNEDRAMSVWIDKLKRRGVLVRHIAVEGTNGFWWDFPIRTGIWAAYPYALTHHMKPEGIECMLNLDQSNKPDALVDSCFIDCKQSSGGWILSNAMHAAREFLASVF